MKVYVGMYHFDYEGSSLSFVASSEKKAIELFKKLERDQRHHFTRINGKLSCDLNRSSQFTIEEILVNSDLYSEYQIEKVQ